MAYQGRDSLWAFGKPLDSGLVPLVVVSYDRVTELVTTLEAFILGESIFWWQVGGAVLLLIFVTVILVGVAKARAMTHPIGLLSAASTQLAAGNYDTRIRIDTGDELQILGDAFNEIGPHLQDRDRMKRCEIRINHHCCGDGGVDAWRQLVTDSVGCGGPEFGYWFWLARNCCQLF